MKPNVAAIQARSNTPTGPRADSHWPEILAAVADRSVPLAEFVRLILMEMSLVCHELQTVSGHSSLEFKLKPLLAEVHALRTLAETTRYVTELTVPTNTSDLEEAKAAYLVGAVINLFKESARQAACPELIWDTIQRTFRFKLEQRSEEIWCGMQEITAGPAVAEASVWLKTAANKPATNSPADTAAEPPPT